MSGVGGDMWGVELAVMVGMVAFNSVFAAYEIALASITLGQLHSLAEAKRKGAAAALYMKQNLEASLAGVQLGITLVGAVAAAVGGAGAEEQIAPTLQDRFGLSSGAAEFYAIALVVVPLTGITIVFGELMPKVFALRNRLWVCLRLSPPLRAFVFAVWPVVWLLEGSVTGLMAVGERLWKSRLKQDAEPAAGLQELRASAALARTTRLIGPREEHIILGAADLPQRPVRTIMISAAAIKTLDANASLSESLTAAHFDMHTRFPVTERAGDPQSIVGYVNFKDIVAVLRADPERSSLRSIVRRIPSFEDDTPVGTCLERLIREHTHIALVRSGNQVVGMVTLEDIIEELVGEIEDEFDALPSYSTPTGAGWVVGGGIDLDRLRELTGLDLRQTPPPDGAGTLSEWVVGHLGRPVQGGEILDRHGVRIVVRKVRRNRVFEAQVQPSQSRETG